MSHSGARQAEISVGRAPEPKDGEGGQVPAHWILDTPHPADLPLPPSRLSDDHLIGANLRFVVRIAHEYRNLGVPLEDLLNEGNIGLIEAARRFDPARGTRFISYAVWWIRKSIRAALTRHSANIYVPEYQRKKVRRVRDAESRLSGALGREANREEISRELGVDVAKIDRILKMKMREISLDETVGPDDSRHRSDALIDTGCVDPETDLMKREARSLLRRALLRLSQREQIVIVNRFGLGGGAPFTLRAIGDRLGASREYARQIEVRSKGRLRRYLARSAPGAILV